MVLTKILWTCFGWEFQWSEPEKIKSQRPPALEDRRTEATASETMNLPRHKPRFLRLRMERP